MAVNYQAVEVCMCGKKKQKTKKQWAHFSTIFTTHLWFLGLIPCKASVQEELGQEDKPMLLKTSEPNIWTSLTAHSKLFLPGTAAAKTYPPWSSSKPVKPALITCEFTVRDEAVGGFLDSILFHQQMQCMVECLCTALSPAQWKSIELRPEEPNAMLWLKAGRKKEEEKKSK